MSSGVTTAVVAFALGYPVSVASALVVGARNWREKRIPIARKLIAHSMRQAQRIAGRQAAPEARLKAFRERLRQNVQEFEAGAERLKAQRRQLALAVGKEKAFIQ